MRKTISQFKLLSSIYLLLIMLVACKDHESATDFDLEGKSMICIINKTNDSIEAKINNWYFISAEEQRLDTSLALNTSLTYELKVQGKTYYDLTINGAKYKIFSRPNARDTIVIKSSSSTDSVEFSGDFKVINQFLFRKKNVFNSADEDLMPRVDATHNADNFSRVITVNDSITQVHISFVQQNSNDLPEWFTNFEIERLKYLNAGFKINSLFYRKAMLDKKETFPAGFIDNLNTSVKVQNPYMLGNMRYMNFLNDYIHYKVDTSFSLSKPSSKKEWQERYNKIFSTTKQELDGLVRDAFLTLSICKIIDTRSHVLDSNWINLIENAGMQNILYNQLTKHQVLPKRSDLPYFYLRANNGDHYEPEMFQNKIALINFWATWCKPCIKEFPYENALVKKFDTEHVSVVNICIDSDFEKWKETVEKHDLKTLNLIAQENWNDVLAEKFDIRGLPHSVLVDNGKIIQNKCPRASEGIGAKINELLNRR